MPTRKLFSEDFLDVGLLSAASGLEADTLLDDNEIFGEFKGALGNSEIHRNENREFVSSCIYYAFFSTAGMSCRPEWPLPLSPGI